jgi:tetratricopeptide (TPR) repeat protein
MRIFAASLILVLATATAVLSQENPQGLFKLALPGRNWALELDIRGFQIRGHEVRPDGEGRKILAENPNTGVIMSIFIEKAPKKGDTKECRDYWWNQTKKSSPLKAEDIKMSERNQLALVEYMVKKYQSQQVNQKNYHAYLAKDDVWVDMHLSKVNFQPSEEKLFYSVLNTVRINEDYSLTSLDYAQFGSGFYLQNNYKQAIEYYRRAFELEKNERTLPINIWRVVLDNLGMSYGLSGDFANAKAVFEYGISQDPDYPMFYYNLACTYAEMSNLEEAIANLRIAFKHKDDMITGERMPNPETDSSFKRFLKNERFRQLLEDISR